MAGDESYVLDVCDHILNCRASRQHRFPFLLGDPGRDGRCRTLPVDAYYEDLGLVIEYWERQHILPTPIMDKKPTCSGCTRGEQRRRYDERRGTLLPANGIKLVVVRYDELAHTSRGRLRRKDVDDETRLRALLSRFLR
jgi:hypothetical protein